MPETIVTLVLPIRMSDWQTFKTRCAVRGEKVTDILAATVRMHGGFNPDAERYTFRGAFREDVRGAVFLHHAALDIVRTYCAPTTSPATQATCLRLTCSIIADAMKKAGCY